MTHAANITLSTPTAQRIYDELKTEGYGLHVDKSEYAKIIKCSLSAVHNYIAQGYGCPDYIKLGGKKNSKILFRLTDIAEYLAKQTVLTA